MNSARGLFARRRLEMTLPPGGPLDGLLLLGRYNYTHALPGLAEHAHRDSMEICFLVKGRQTYRVANHDYGLNGGDVFITFPNERHSTGESPEEKGVLYWMVLKLPGAGKPFLGLASPNARPLIQELLWLNRRHFRGSADMKDLLDAMTLAYHQPRSRLTLTLMANRAVMFLLRVIECAHAAPAGASSKKLRKVLRYIDEHLDEALALADLAAHAGLSLPRFKVRFKQEIGMPPGEYVLRMKIDEAKRRLSRRGASVTETAFALGFSTSQYFATVFKRFTGQRPSDFQGRRITPPQRNYKFSLEKNGRRCRFSIRTDETTS